MKKQIIVEIKEKIAFSDIDMARWAWHGAYARYYENAREALLDLIGYGCCRTMDENVYWPVVSFNCSFHKPLYFKQEIIISAQLISWDDCIKIKYHITDAVTKQITSKAVTVQLPMDPVTKRQIYPIPDSLRLCVEKYFERISAND